jgi:hypothetical protein
LFLNEKGQFERIDELVLRSGKIVLEGGTLQAVTAERITYSEETRHLYEETDEVICEIQSGLAFKQAVKLGWRTYNFEVGKLHTYIAGGVLVHNDSLQDYLSLSALMRNESYVAVAFDDIKGRWGASAAAMAAYRNEPWGSREYSQHVNDMVKAHNDAVAKGDYGLARGIREGLSNVLETGVNPGIREARNAYDQNPDSTTR